jgi:hypothetical protein
MVRRRCLGCRCCRYCRCKDCRCPSRMDCPAELHPAGHCRCRCRDRRVGRCRCRCRDPREARCHFREVTVSGWASALGSEPASVLVRVLESVLESESAWAAAVHPHCLGRPHCRCCQCKDCRSPLRTGLQAERRLGVRSHSQCRYRTAVHSRCRCRCRDPTAARCRYRGRRVGRCRCRCQGQASGHCHGPFPSPTKVR